MSAQPQRHEQVSLAITHRSVMLVVFALGVSLTFMFKATDFWAILLLPELTRLLQYFEVNSHWQTVAAFRYLADILQNLASQMVAKSEWMFLENPPCPLPFGLRIKNVLMMGACDISVIVPTLNEEKYISGCLESLTSQSFDGDYEVIVVDGGSNDRTVEIADRFTDHIVSCATRPVGAARNQGARLARGRVVAFIDADTIASKYWLRAIEESLKDYSIIGVTGPTLPSDGAALDSVTYRLWTIYLQKVLLWIGMPHVIGFNCAYRKGPFVMVGGFDETNVTAEDIRLALKIRRLGRIAFQKQMSALTSARRFQKYGRAYMAGLYLVNGFSTLLLDRSSKSYPPVR